jgi:adenine/guanine phosphoribosyltransferase-like PRPP-binding protein
MPFQKGQSGNLAGKPVGARNKASIMVERLMEDGVEQIVAAVVSAAIAGVVSAAKLVLDRLAPVRRHRPFDMPRVESLDDLSAAKAAVTQPH